MKQLNLYYIGGGEQKPEGRTVEPTDDIQIWLKCAGLNKPYTTLAEVLADSSTLAALIADSNAVDYLVRSKSFAGNTKQSLVPSMTGYTTPSGVVSASSENSSYPAWKAFDGSDSSFFASTSTTIGTYLQYDFGANNGKKATSIRIKSRNTGGYVIKGSNDGFVSDTHTLYTTHTMVDSEEGEFDLSNVDTYRYYRIELSANPNSATLSLWEVQFYYATSGITTNATAMSYIGLNNYASNTLLADSTWLNAIANSAYIESVMNVKVPVMTSNTTPSGVASVQGSIQNGDAYNAFDDNNSTYIQPNAYPLGVGYTFPNAVKIYCAIVNFTENTRVAKAFEIQESSDSFTTVSTLASDSDNTLTEVIKAFNGTTNISFRCYISSGVGSWVRVKKLQFYGRADI